VESGFPWAPRYFEDLPNVGTVDFPLDDLRNLRSETVTIVDFRADKTFTFRDRYRFTVMADVYNLLNANPELDFVVHAGSDYRNIAEWLPGRTLKIGLRFQFCGERDPKRMRVFRKRVRARSWPCFEVRWTSRVVVI
jgi:outer membrane receptor protein involved in Fe transport